MSLFPPPKIARVAGQNMADILLALPESLYQLQEFLYPTIDFNSIPI
jgi:hypothetical protein